jgi:hypothetical protein
MADRRDPRSRRYVMGLGLDSDGHLRVTKAEEYLLVGGSEETHGTMRKHVERFSETLEEMGTDLQHASKEEMLEAARESGLLGRRRR